MKKVKLTGMLVVGMVLVFSVANVKGASFGTQAENKVSKVEKTGIIQLKGHLNKKLEGNYDLIAEIFADQAQTELLSSKEFKAVEIKEGYYELPLNIEEFGLTIGTEYWLKVSVINADIPETLAQLKILPSQIIESSVEGDAPVITAKYYIEGNDPAPNGYVVWVKNLNNGYGLKAESTGGTAVYALTSGTGTAIVAENPSGTAISANGDVAVTGDLNVTGQTNLTGGDLTLGGKLTVSGTGDSSFAGRLGIGDTTPAAKFTVGPNSEFRITATGEVRNIDGKETAPAYSFVAGGGNTGMWRTGTNTLAFSTAGGQRLTIDETGNIGIGDKTPSSLLTVGDGDKFRVDGAGIIRSVNGSVSSPTYSFTNDPDSGMFFEEISPLYKKLHLVFNSTPYISIEQIGTVFNGSYFQFGATQLESPAISGGGFYAKPNLGGPAFSFINQTGAGLGYHSLTGGLQLETDHTTRMLIQGQTGNVGIGHPFPGINAGATRYFTLASTRAYGNDATAIEIEGSSTSGDQHFGRIDFNMFGTTSKLVARIAAYRGTTPEMGSLAFWTHNGISFNRAMTLDESGQVGLGTITPGTKLEISGGLTINPDRTPFLIVADNTTLTVGDRTVYRIDSDSSPANRTLILTNGLTDGQLLILTSINASPTNGFELLDSANVRVPGTGITLNTGDTITLQYDLLLNQWLTLASSNN